MSDISARLRTLRGDATITQITSQIGVSQPAWTRWERGDREPNVEAIRRICQHFGVSSDWLLGLSDDCATGGGSVSAVAHGDGAIAVGRGNVRITGRRADRATSTAKCDGKSCPAAKKLKQLEKLFKEK